jgi:hypothetical protein
MRWKTKGAKIVLSLRALTNTLGRWTQFWQKIDQSGGSASAEDIIARPHPAGGYLAAWISCG